MSGVEIFGAVGSAATLAGAILKFYPILYTFLDSVKGAESEAQGFREKILQLYTLSSNTKSYLRIYRRSIGDTQLTDEEAEVIESVETAARSCHKQVDAFAKEIEKLLWDGAPKGKSASLKYEWKYVRQRTSLEKTQSAIQDGQLVLQTNIHILESFQTFRSQQQNERQHKQNEEYFNRMLQSIASLHKRLQQLNQAQEELFSQQTPFPSQEYDHVLNRDHLKKTINAAERAQAKLIQFDPTISDRLSISYGSDNSSTAPSAPSSASSVPISGIKAPPDDFEDIAGVPEITHVEPLRQLAFSLDEHSQVCLERRWYTEAAEALQDSISCFEELERSHNHPFTKSVAMYRKLANVYSEQGKWKEVEKIQWAILRKEIGPALQPSVVPPVISLDVDHMRLCSDSFHDLASMNFNRAMRDSECRKKHLSSAERLVKRAFYLRRNLLKLDDADFLATVHVTIDIYQALEKIVHADTYRRMYAPYRAPISEARLSMSTLRKASTAETSSSTSPVDPIISRSGSTQQDSAIAIEEELMGQPEAQIPENKELQLKVSRNSSIGNKTAMQYAIDVLDNQAVKQLLLNGAKIEEALFYAIETSNEFIASWLLKHDASVNAEDANGLTPLVKTTKRRNQQMIQFLLDHGAKPSQPSGSRNFRRTAVHEAVWDNNLETLRTLLATEGDPADLGLDVYDANGMTPLHTAARLGHIDVAQMLLVKGASLEAEDLSSRKRTPLHLAVELGDYVLVRLLVKTHHAVIDERLNDVEGTASDDIKNLLNKHKRKDSVQAKSKPKKRWPSFGSGSNKGK